MEAIAADTLPAVFVISKTSFSVIEKYTSTVLILETVVNGCGLDALTKAPCLKGRLPTTPAAGLFT